jgi:replicative DNA helicase
MTTIRDRLADLKHVGHEVALCNLVLVFPDLYLECMEVQPRHFSDPLVRLMWLKIQTANDERNRDATIPAPNLASILHERDPELMRLADEHYGGFAALRRDFIDLKPRQEHLAMFRDRVLSMSQQRDMLERVAGLQQRLTDMASPITPMVEAMQDAIEVETTAILRMTSGRDRSGGLMAEMDPESWIAAQKALVEEKGEIHSFDTGMNDFDFLGLLQPGRVTLFILEYKGGKSTWGVTLAARLGVGRRLSSWADVGRGYAATTGQEVIYHNANWEPLTRRRVGYIDVEMGKELDVLPRIQSFISGVPVKMIQSRAWLRTEEDTWRVKWAYEWIRASGMKFWHKANFNLRWLRSVIREAVYRDRIEIFIIDYLRAPPGMTKDQELEFQTQMAMAIKSLAEEFGVAIVTFAQFNREGNSGQRMKFGGNRRRPSGSNIQGPIKILNYVDTSLVQDEHPDDPKKRRLWVDVSRIVEKSTNEYLLVEANLAFSNFEVVGIETLPDEHEELRRGDGEPRRSRYKTKRDEPKPQDASQEAPTTDDPEDKRTPEEREADRKKQDDLFERARQVAQQDGGQTAFGFDYGDDDEPPSPAAMGWVPPPDDF